MMGPIPGQQDVSKAGSNSKISSFFAPKVSSRCPICQIPISVRDINQHLDAGNCVPPPPKEPDPDPFSKDNDDFDFPDSDSEYEKLDVTEAGVNPPAKLKASRSISNHPNRFKLPGISPSSSQQVSSLNDHRLTWYE